MNLKDKKILFIGPVTYNYHVEIYNELVNMGAKVDFFGENTLSLVYRVLKKTSNSLCSHYINIFRKKIEKKIDRNQYNYIFVIRGDFLSIDFLEKIKRKQPTAKFLMYQWDSVKVFNYLNLIEVFDKVYSFDPEDCKQYDFEYLPLFYDNDYKNLRSSTDKSTAIDLLFIGSLHSDRLEVLKKLDIQAKQYNLKTKFFLFIPFFTFLKNIIFNKNFKYKKSYMIFKSLNKSAVLDLFSKSKVIVDINNINQSGLTIRTIEALGAGKKLLTTNKSVLKNDFYHTQNIALIDRKNPKINLDFLNQSYIYTDNTKLSINNFIKKIFLPNYTRVG